ncbi:cardiolipin synthase [Tumebacillus sp. DT12]|uniref:Cardiolipin synthase n=1 Tax=Tumebacillus lacus TaxID=2995335 RepID=A0ABT3WZI1_9BACL|nr:cardiolipin synthase [Tumebacillus lacus]MCX7568927.1 cardiolipin synthase [Tumebacillus lacus]
MVAIICSSVLLFLGSFFYLSFRKRKLFQRPAGNHGDLENFIDQQKGQLQNLSAMHGKGASHIHRLVQLLTENHAAPLTSNNRAQVLTNGEEKFRELKQALLQAKHYIHIEYYTVKDDQIGREIRDLLIMKCSEGVKVRMIIDGLGSRKIPKRVLQDMLKAGIEIKHFLPITLRNLLKLNFRNHRKIVVIDGTLGFIGGMNIGDEYLSRNQRIGFWRDTHLKIEGACVRDLQKTFVDDWHYLTGCQLQLTNDLPKSESEGCQFIQIANCGPSCEGELIRDLFHLAIMTAQRRVYIQTPYFAPCRRTLAALKQAAQNGLDVRLIVQGCTITPLTFWAAQSYFADLLRAGVKIYMYQKGILHSKVLVVDDLFASVGSANFDIRSFQLNFETNAVLYDRQLVARLEQDFLQDIEDSVRVCPRLHRQRPLSHRCKEAAARMFAPLL